MANSLYHTTDRSTLPHRELAEWTCVLCGTWAEMPKKQQFQAQGCACTGRAESLQRAFHSDGIHIVGLQETRIRTNGRTSGECYDVISSAATDQGSHGVQLWLAQHLRPKVNAAEAVNTKMLLASVTIGKGARRSPLLFVVAHAWECVETFQAFQIPHCGKGSIDEATTKLTECVQTVATKAFCPLPNKEKRHWITDDAWEYIREVPIARRSFLEMGSSVTLSVASTCGEQTWPVCWFVPSFLVHGGWVTRTMLLFMDLAAAFDFAIREKVVGYSSAPPQTFAGFGFAFGCCHRPGFELTANPGSLLEH